MNTCVEKNNITIWLANHVRPDDNVLQEIAHSLFGEGETWINSWEANLESLIHEIWDTTGNQIVVFDTLELSAQDTMIANRLALANSRDEIPVRVIAIQQRILASSYHMLTEGRWVLNE